MTGFDARDIAEFRSQAEHYIKKVYGTTDYAFVDDSPADTPYHPYDPDNEKPATQIYIEAPGKGSKELSSISDPVDQLRKYKLLRYYYPSEARVEVERIARETLKGG